MYFDPPKSRHDFTDDADEHRRRVNKLILTRMRLEKERMNINHERVVNRNPYREPSLHLGYDERKIISKYAEVVRAKHKKNNESDMRFESDIRKFIEKITDVINGIFGYKLAKLIIAYYKWVFGKKKHDYRYLERDKIYTKI